MPAIYAHDKFGKMVAKNLSTDLKDIIKKYPNSFRIGLQGPDTLFFYRPGTKNKVNSLGRKIHHTNAFVFFEKALNNLKKYPYQSAEHAYIIGCICHYCLDKNCHPVVNKLISKTKCGHLEIEGDFEHYLMTLDSHIPHKHQIYRLIPTDSCTAKSLQPAYTELSLQQLNDSIKHMRFFRRALYAPNKIKRHILRFFLYITGQKNIYKGHVVHPFANKKCRESMKELLYKFEYSIDYAVKAIDDFENCLQTGGTLSEFFQGDFNNK